MQEDDEEEELDEVAAILLRLQENLSVNPRSRRYTTRTVTGRRSMALSTQRATCQRPYHVVTTF